MDDEVTDSNPLVSGSQPTRVPMPKEVAKNLEALDLQVISSIKLQGQPGRNGYVGPMNRVREEAIEASFCTEGAIRLDRSTRSILEIAIQTDQWTFATNG